MKTGYSIGRGGPQHLQYLPAIEQEAGRLFEGWEIPAGALSYITLLEEFQQAYADGHLWIAFSPGHEPVGFALVEILDGQPHLEEIDVLPSHGRQGIGRALVAEIVAWAERAGYSSITLTTFRDIPWNEPYYRRLGFRTVDPSELRADLQARVTEEASHGLDPARRVVMTHNLRERAAD